MPSSAEVHHNGMGKRTRTLETQRRVVVVPILSGDLPDKQS